MLGKLSGFTSYFGRQGLGKTLLRGAASMNPIDIARGVGARGAGNRETSMGTHFMKQVGATMRGAGTTWKSARQKGMGFTDMAKHYWKGHNLSDVAADLGVEGMRRTPKGDIRRNMFVRRTVLGAMGASTAASYMMGSDNAVSNTVGFAQQGLVHAGVSAGLGAYKPGLGAAYAGWAGLNMMRRGDNFGPF